MEFVPMPYKLSKILPWMIKISSANKYRWQLYQNMWFREDYVMTANGYALLAAHINRAEFPDGVEPGEVYRMNDHRNAFGIKRVSSDIVPERVIPKSDPDFNTYVDADIMRTVLSGMYGTVRISSRYSRNDDGHIEVFGHHNVFDTEVYAVVVPMTYNLDQEWRPPWRD